MKTKFSFPIFLMVFLLSGQLVSTEARAGLDFAVRASSGVMKTYPNGDDDKYLETELAVEYKFPGALSLQGAVFSRFADDDTFWGVQVTAPLSLVVPGSFLSSYIAPGYRYMNDKYSAPVIEGGLNIHFFGRFGLGYRFIFNEWVKNGLETEGQFFITAYL